MNKYLNDRETDRVHVNLKLEQRPELDYIYLSISTLLFLSLSVYYTILLHY